MPNLALIGLGSNLGDRKALLDSAVAALADTPGITPRGVSSYRETPPVGGPSGQGAFLNAAAALETSLGPEELLEVLHTIEASAGRARVVRWGERTLDLDLLLYGDLVVETPRLRVPHPRMALRRFVLAPLADVAPDAIDPVTGRTVRELLANLDRRPSYVAIANTPQFHWPKSFGDDRSADPKSDDKSLLFGGSGASLHAALCRQLRAVGVENRVTELVLEHPDDPALIGDALRSNSYLDGNDPSVVSDWLDAEACANLVPADGWLVSHFWFDTLFLGLDSLKTLMPRHRHYVEEFLEARSRALPPTFVVARPKDVERFGIQDPRYAWRRPVGWDSPVVLVDDFDRDASLTEVVASCKATRAG
jgi:2-amino-4-hydroxy-6-hydroxymethyldihydropteridine diphosphokinase